MKKRLKFICDKENLKYDKDGLSALIMTTEGDMRKAINNLQLINSGFKKVTKSAVYKLCDAPNMIYIKDIIESCANGELTKSLKSVKHLYDKGYSSLDISLGLFKCIKLGEINISTKFQYEYGNIISKTCMVVSEGITTELQMTSCICQMCKISS